MAAAVPRENLGRVLISATARMLESGGARHRRSYGIGDSLCPIAHVGVDCPRWVLQHGTNRRGCGLCKSWPATRRNTGDAAAIDKCTRRIRILLQQMFLVSRASMRQATIPRVREAG